ncbi:glycosyltransferase family 4 protein [Ramlibacter sp. AN1015]|uniref:glycosyltransferase family 4 protein n=1 Tax=Ramlibacter sp. AN1015 TaxID=3133428 RepID=UPI0030C46814
MRLALIADSYPPLRSSGAVQLRDLSVEFARQGHEITVLVSAPELAKPWVIETYEGVQVVRLRTPRTRDTSYVRRTLAELVMPHAMLRNLRKSPLRDQRWDGIVWYSPSIFFGPMVQALKSQSACRSYLIIRDIFPEWAVDMGLMGRGLPYRFFKAVANHQYAVADVIGIQTPGNAVYFREWEQESGRVLEVLPNWLADAPNRGCSISIASTRLAGRKIFVYAGNMGVAQGAGLLLDLADRLRRRPDIGFVFVGRGSDADALRAEAGRRRLDNVLFFEEIDPSEIPGLYAQCQVGLVCLDPKHKTHNIPGKFLSYMQAGLPVLASINPGNDLVQLIASRRVGAVSTDGSADALEVEAEKLLVEVARDTDYHARCRALAQTMFSPEATVVRIVAALSEDHATATAAAAA